MRTFDHPNIENFVCPICKTSDDKPVVLVGIDGTQNGNLIEGVQVHLDCIDLKIKIFDDGESLLYMYVDVK